MEKEILEFYRQNKRDLPWRKDKKPYYIWISEIMCQQTRVDTVIPYFNRFIKKYPDISSLASSDEDELLKYWEGLGYYNRCRNLRKAALVIVKDYQGIFPDNYEDILALPGIGDYTACAILSMAFNKPYISVDGNFYRVFSRYYQNKEDITKEETKEKLKKKLLTLIHDNYGDFNQAIMDIGATICIPNEEPKCEKCPLKKECKLFDSPDYIYYPYSSKEQKIKDLDYTIYIIKCRDKYVLHKRVKDSLLHDLYEFKNVTGFSSLEDIKKKYKKAQVSFLSSKSHHFSHQTWHMKAYFIETEDYTLKEDEVFANFEELKNVYSIPKAFNQFLPELK